MRERIDSLRKERVVFDMIYRQLESDIKTKREELIAIMARTDRAEKSRDESRVELERMKGEASKLKELFSQEWTEVVDKSLKEQNETTMGEEKEKTIEKKDTTVILGGKKDRDDLKSALNKQKSSSERKDVKTAHGGNDKEGEGGSTYANKLRSITARAAWAVARDTGSIHVSMQKVQQYEEALATVKEAIGMNGTLQEVVERF